MRVESAGELQRWKQLRVVVTPSAVGTDRVNFALFAISQVGRRQHVTELVRYHADFAHEIGSVSECIDTVVQALSECRSRL